MKLFMILALVYEEAVICEQKILPEVFSSKVQAEEHLAKSCMFDPTFEAWVNPMTVMVDHEEGGKIIQAETYQIFEGQLVGESEEAIQEEPGASFQDYVEAGIETLELE